MCKGENSDRFHLLCLLLDQFSGILISLFNSPRLSLKLNIGVKLVKLIPYTGIRSQFLPESFFYK